MKGWTVIVPVKGLSAAKSRLAADGPVVALAFLADVLVAVTDCAAAHTVIVTTHDPTVVALAREHGAEICDDQAHPGINPAARHAAARLTGPVAVIVSDLPCLTGPDLTEVLTAAGAHRRSFVRDADGTGTTILLATQAADLDPQFGPLSAAAHSATGAADLTQDGGFARARRDVDTVTALSDALRQGVGPATRAAVGPPSA